MQLYSNNASTTLDASITSSDTSITVAVGTGNLFNTVAFPNIETITITDGTNIEIVNITGRTGDSLTVVRGLEGTVPFAFGAGATIEGRITKGVLENLQLTVGNTLFESSSVGTGSISLTINSGGATGATSLALGNGPQASGDDSIALGKTPISSGLGAIALGTAPTASGTNTIGIGNGTTATGVNAIAIGDIADSPIAHAINFSGINIVRKNNSIYNALSPHEVYSGNQVVILSEEIDLKTALDFADTVIFDTGSTFYLDEVGLIVSTATAITVAPNISFGSSSNSTSLLASTASTKLVAKGRDKFTPLSLDGQVTLSGSVKTAATGTSMTGRFYWKGVLVED